MISGQKSYNGVALLSREPLEEVRIGFDALLPGDEAAIELSQQKRVISAWVDGVRVLNLYVPNGSEVGSEKYAYKLAWLECLRRYLDVQREQGEPFCMLGDFNIGLEDRDLPDPARLNGTIMASTAERDALRACLGDDLRDAFRLFEPDGGHWSWWDYRSGAWNRDRGWRIDHLYICEELQQRALRCQIHKESAAGKTQRSRAGSVDPGDEAAEEDKTKAPGSHTTSTPSGSWIWSAAAGFTAAHRGGEELAWIGALGSKALRTSCIVSRSDGSNIQSRKQRLSAPTPCSPLMLPPASTQRRRIAAPRALTRCCTPSSRPL